MVWHMNCIPIFVSLFGFKQKKKTKDCNVRFKFWHLKLAMGLWASAPHFRVSASGGY